MAISRETFELVARVLRREIDEINRRGEARTWARGVTVETVESIASGFITEFEQANESFDRERFLIAAGLTF